MAWLKFSLELTRATLAVPFEFSKPLMMRVSSPVPGSPAKAAGKGAAARTAARKIRSVKGFILFLLSVKGLS
nr:hypothetical protein [Desulfobacula sp.]